MNEQTSQEQPSESAKLPKTLEEAVDFLLPSFEGFEAYPDRGEDDFVAFCRSQRSGNSIGWKIINVLQLYVHESPLHQHFLTVHNQFDPEEMSALIIRSIYRKLFPAKPASLFDIDHQYSLYLQRMGLKEEQLHPVQKIQTKQAFYGAWGQLLICMRDDISALPEAEGMNVLDLMTEQVAIFWAIEVEKYKAQNQ